MVMPGILNSLIRHSSSPGLSSSPVSNPSSPAAAAPGESFSFSVSDAEAEAVARGAYDDSGSGLMEKQEQGEGRKADDRLC